MHFCESQDVKKLSTDKYSQKTLLILAKHLYIDFLPFSKKIGSKNSQLNF